MPGFSGVFAGDLSNEDKKLPTPEREQGCDKARRSVPLPVAKNVQSSALAGRPSAYAERSRLSGIDANADQRHC